MTNAPVEAGASGRPEALADVVEIPVAPVEWAIAPGVAVRGERWGAVGPNVVLLHASGGDLDDWAGLPRWLAQSTPCVCWALDLPGHGLSDDRPPNMAPADAIAALLTASAAADDGSWFAVAAGDSAAALLRAAPGPLPVGIVLLRPGPALDSADPIPRTPNIPKLAIVGASAEEARQARVLARQAGGWLLVSAVQANPADRSLLRGPWAMHVGEQIAAFVRDCLRQRR